MISFVYDFYEDISGSDPLLNRRKPILFSISSLRRHNASCKIVVYDSGLIRQDWTRYSKELDFEVRHTAPFRFSVGYPLADSRSFQKLWLLTEEDFDDTIVASVSPRHIFLSDPTRPEYQDYLCGGDREGMFFHSRHSERSCLMMDRWKAMCSLFMEPGTTQRSIYEFNKRRPVDETIVMNYILRQDIPESWVVIPYGWCVQMYDIRSYVKYQMPYSVTLNESFTGIDQVSLIMAFEELYDATRCGYYLRDRSIGKPGFSLKDLLDVDKVSEIRSMLNLQNTPYFRFSEETLWRPPLHEIMDS